MIEPPPTYDRRNEYENRNKLEAELAQKYDKRTNIVVPYGKSLSFAGVEGQLITFGYSTSGGFLINGVGASSSLIFTVSSFIVSNGVSNENPFEVSGGVVKIKTANVGTLTAANISTSTLSALAADLGTVTAGTLRNAGDTFNIDATNGRIRFTSGSYVLYEGNGFGASNDLIMWYGSSATAIGSTTKTNGIWAFATDGKVYYGADELVNTADAVLMVLPSDEFADGSGNESTIEQTFAVTLTISGGTAPYDVYWRDLEYEPLETGVYGVFTIDDPSGTTVQWEATIDPSGEYTAAVWQARVRDADGRVAYTEVIPRLFNEDF